MKKILRKLLFALEGLCLGLAMLMAISSLCGENKYEAEVGFINVHCSRVMFFACAVGFVIGLALRYVLKERRPKWTLALNILPIVFGLVCMVYIIPGIVSGDVFYRMIKPHGWLTDIMTIEATIAGPPAYAPSWIWYVICACVMMRAAVKYKKTSDVAMFMGGIVLACVLRDIIMFSIEGLGADVMNPKERITEVLNYWMIGLGGLLMVAMCAGDTVTSLKINEEKKEKKKK